MPVEFLAIGLLGGVLVFLLITALFQWLWNSTVPELFGLTRVTYWQALRLLLLGLILFGGAGVGFRMSG